MGHNVTCKIVGISIILIKMHDGIVRTLTNVSHVLELKKFFISHLTPMDAHIRLEVEF